ncbi:hypothetical protein [Thiorhodococcus minor]|uniref:Uncharacterized protein n=1 Tax=Thiorhodococcus minor TaxID=57489 RepID=A0A6M0JU13_9GAMM|nr:hypothetical protein [Thiorhodococcus minor]NEV60421.1 hypothetical protein [Thiorhodococcus minor]
MRSPARYLWCQRLIAFVTEAASIEQMLSRIGEPPRPPLIVPARGPSAWEDVLESELDLRIAPARWSSCDQMSAR